MLKASFLENGFPSLRAPFPINQGQSCADTQLILDLNNIINSYQGFSVHLTPELCDGERECVSSPFNHPFHQIMNFNSPPSLHLVGQKYYGLPDTPRDFKTWRALFIFKCIKVTGKYSLMKKAPMPGAKPTLCSFCNSPRHKKFWGTVDVGSGVELEEGWDRKRRSKAKLIL